MVVTGVAGTGIIINYRIARVVAVGCAINVMPALGQVVGTARGAARVAVEVLRPRIVGDSTAWGGEGSAGSPSAGRSVAVTHALHPGLVTRDGLKGKRGGGEVGALEHWGPVGIVAALDFHVVGAAAAAPGEGGGGAGHVRSHASFGLCAAASGGRLVGKGGLGEESCTRSS